MAIIQGKSSSQLVLKVTWKLLKMFSDKLSELRTCSRSFLGQKNFMNIMINVKILYSLKAYSLRKKDGKNEF